MQAYDMFFNIDDLEIKNSILKYKEEDEDEVYYSLILEIISPFIYNYPHVVFHASEDICSDFYEYILLRFKTILNSYTISKAKFTTWLTVVLRNRYINFLRENPGLNNTEYNVSFEQDLNISDPNGSNYHMVIADKKNYNLDPNEEVNVLIDKITSILNEKYRVLFHLYYVDFLRVEDIRFLALFFNRSMNEIVKGIDEIKSSIVDKYEKKELTLVKLVKNYRKILESQESGDRITEKNAKKYQENLLNEYRAAKCYPTYESIASFCGFPIGTVSAGIARIKSRIKSFEKELKNI